MRIFKREKDAAQARLVLIIEENIIFSRYFWYQWLEIKPWRQPQGKLIFFAKTGETSNHADIIPKERRAIFVGRWSWGRVVEKGAKK
jgi:hypothetical protein